MDTGLGILGVLQIRWKREGQFRMRIQRRATSPYLTERAQGARVRLALDLALREGIPEAQGLVSSASDDGLAVGRVGEVQHLQAEQTVSVTDECRGSSSGRTRKVWPVSCATCCIDG